MSWGDKIKSIDEVAVFCKDWKTTTEIREQFNLTAAEAWGCMRFCMKLTSDFEHRSNVGATTRSYAIKTRLHYLKKNRAKMKSTD